MAAIAKAIVTDASVVLKTVFRDEDYVDEADRLIDDSTAGRLALHAPTLIDYEIANALKSAVLKGRSDQGKALAALTKFRSFAVQRHDFESFQDRTLQLSLQFGRSVYDSSYVALADSLDVWLYTGYKK